MKTFGLFALIIVAYLLDGLALKMLWGWFLVPVFGLPTISLTQAIGVGIVIGFLTQQHIPRDEKQRREMFIYTVIAPVTAVAVGWVVHLFM